MGKYCSYRVCQTRHDVDRDKPKRLGLPQLSVFKVPRNMLQRWSKTIRHSLSQTHLVCELQFSDDLINKEDRIQMANGTLNVIRRFRPSLVAGAVPITVDNQENVDNSKENVPNNTIPEPPSERALVCDDSVTQTSSLFVPVLLPKS